MTAVGPLVIHLAAAILLWGRDTTRLHAQHPNRYRGAREDTHTHAQEATAETVKIYLCVHTERGLFTSVHMHMPIQLASHEDWKYGVEQKKRHDEGTCGAARDACRRILSSQYPVQLIITDVISANIVVLRAGQRSLREGTAQIFQQQRRAGTARDRRIGAFQSH